MNEVGMEHKTQAGKYTCMWHTWTSRKNDFI